MAFKTMMGPDTRMTKETFDTPPRNNPPADFSPLVLTGYDATIDGLHSYKKDGYWYVDWMECTSLFGRSLLDCWWGMDSRECRVLPCDPRGDSRAVVVSPV